MKHPAAQPRKPMKEIAFAQVDNMDNKVIGRRTGKVLDDKYSNGNDFLLKDEFSHLLDRNQNLLEMYSSSSDESEKNSKLELSSSSSEAEEASDEESASDIKEKSHKSKATENSKATTKIKEKKDLSNIRNQLLKESEPYDLELVNGKLAQIHSPQSEISDHSDESSPNFNKENKNKKKSANKENSYPTNNIQNVEKNIVSNNLIPPQTSIKKNAGITKQTNEEDDGLNLSFVTEHKTNRLITNVETARRKEMNSSLSSIKKRGNDTSNLLTDNELEVKNQGGKSTIKKTNKKLSDKHGDNDVKIEEIQSGSFGALNNLNNEVKYENESNDSFQLEDKNKKDLIEKKQIKNEIKITKKNKTENEEKKGVKRKYKEMNEEYKKEEVKAIKKAKSGKKVVITESQLLKESYNKMFDSQPQNHNIEIDNEQFFGVSNRYSKRIRINRLNHLAGERLQYKVIKDPILKINLPCLVSISTNQDFNKCINNKNYEVKKKSKRRLTKGLKKIKEEDEEFSDKDSKNGDDDNLKEDFEEEESSEKRAIIKILPKSQKGFSKNFQVYLKCEVLNTVSKNKVIFGGKQLLNVKKGEKFVIPPSVDFNFFNYSKDDLRIRLLIENSNN